MSSMEKIVRLLKGADGYISGERIARELGVSRATVWKQISVLREKGFSIHSQPKLGYSLTFSPDRLMPSEVRDGLDTSVIGNEVIYFPETESTNLIAKNMATDGAREGTIVIAEAQTRGRGRLDRNWLAPPNKNILMSVIFRPRIPPSRVFSLTEITSLAIVKAIKETATLPALIKWPNDIYIGGKKAGGILTEFSAEQDRVNFVIVGMGLNVNFDPSLYQEIKDTATSVSKALGKKVHRIKLLQSILIEIEKGYNLLKKGNGFQIHNEWKTYSLITGKPVRIISSGTVEEGIAEAVDGDGCLTLRCENGKRKRILSGDVSLRFKD